ncbi:MAG TPA: hypothetical protein VFV66_33975, partial [Nonomuraea sp.]|nr:hypothetical protein [Nonomuraea sp.]
LLDELLDAAVGYIRANRDLCEVCLKFTPPADPYHDAAGAFLQPLTEAIAKGARHDRISVSDPSATAYLLGAALGGTLCTSVVYGSPPLDRLIPAAKELFLRTLDPAGER